MQTKNNFSETTRFYFLDDNYWCCWACGRNHADCLHHIFGRGTVEGCEKSPFNAAPMGNQQCHLPRHGYWMTVRGRQELFKKTLAHLERVGYNLDEQDRRFLQKYGSQIYKLGIKI